MVQNLLLLIDKYVEENDTFRPDDLVVKIYRNKFSQYYTLFKNIDRKLFSMIL
jgi:hypothetical protein